jgi:hypothetical protein
MFELSLPIFLEGNHYIIFDNKKYIPLRYNKDKKFLKIALLEDQSKKFKLSKENLKFCTIPRENLPCFNIISEDFKEGDRFMVFYLIKSNKLSGFLPFDSF